METYWASMKKLFFNIVLLVLSPLMNYGQVCISFTDKITVVQNEQLASYFDRQIEVFGLTIYAEPSVPHDKLVYVATVWAELIDNNEDGIVDDPKILDQLALSQAIMPVFGSQKSKAIRNIEKLIGDDQLGAILWAEEINPASPGIVGEDATVEELLHTMNSIGHVAVYPELFYLEPGSSALTEALDEARGGQFIKHPRRYPDEAWFHYDDRTCDYQCMAIEYLYWAILANMNTLNAIDPEVYEMIKGEWELIDRNALRSDELMWKLLNESDVILPSRSPDGCYTPSN